MAQAALGVKRKCLSCGAAFFDLLRDPIVCPRCKAAFTPPPPPTPRRELYKPYILAAVEPTLPEEPNAAGEDPEDAADDDPAVGAEGDPDEKPDAKSEDGAPP